MNYFDRFQGLIEEELSRAIDEAVVVEASDPCLHVGLRLLSGRARQQQRKVSSPAGGGKWTAVGWLASQDVATSVAEALLDGGQIGDPNSPGTMELEAIQALGTKSVDEIAIHLLKGGVVHRLAQRLHPALRTLSACAVVADAEELHSKFVQDGSAFTLKFGDIASFYGGLEAKIGAPDNKIMDAMHREHTASADSRVLFTTTNYRVTTTPATEWAFVVHPDKSAADWPKEARIDPTRERAPLLLRSLLPDEDTLEKKMAEVNGRLEKLGQQFMLIEEAIGGRLYTGPMCAPQTAA